MDKLIEFSASSFSSFISLSATVRDGGIILLRSCFVLPVLNSSLTRATSAASTASGLILTEDSAELIRSMYSPPSSLSFEPRGPSNINLAAAPPGTRSFIRGDSCCDDVKTGGDNVLFPCPVRGVTDDCSSDTRLLISGVAKFARSSIPSPFISSFVTVRDVTFFRDGLVGCVVAVLCDATEYEPDRPNSPVDNVLTPGVE